VQALRDRLIRDALQALDAVNRTDEQLEILRSQLGSEGNTALRAAEAAYAEGEITLLEWLDAVRAYQEAQLSVSNLTAEAIAQRAALERSTGASFIR
jgi:outer membrane protein TolC